MLAAFTVLHASYASSMSFLHLLCWQVHAKWSQFSTWHRPLAGDDIAKQWYYKGSVAMVSCAVQMRLAIRHPRPRMQSMPFWQQLWQSMCGGREGLPVLATPCRAALMEEAMIRRMTTKQLLFVGALFTYMCCMLLHTLETVDNSLVSLMR